MKLHILSDLHNELSAFDPIRTDADVIVLSGDIGQAVDGICWARDAFPDKEIVYVPGNHEFYGTCRPEALALMRAAAKEHGVRLLDEDEALIGGVRFLGATLWTDFELFGRERKREAMVAGQRSLNDFRLIWEGAGERFSPERSIELHHQALAWLEARLSEPFAGKTVVVTHHLPSMRSVPGRFKDDPVSACFASNLDRLFGRMDLWIHGHTHDNLDYLANGTRVVCNPRGYVRYSGIENANFDPRLVIEL